MLYKLYRNLVFHMDPERAHDLTFSLINPAYKLGLLRLIQGCPVSDPVQVMGLEFPNRIGLAAGLDKDGKYIDALGALGFGFIEVGTVTPLPQPGNEPPRLFRIIPEQAIINRMGFNNDGVAALVQRAEHRTWPGVLGINIGKNKVTPNENAVDDYLACMRAVYPVADYIAINISSPNTPGLRELQGGDYLQNLLTTLKREQEVLRERHQKQVPLAVKIAPDLSPEEIEQVADVVQQTTCEAVIATNTTLSREGVEAYPASKEAGGLSGAPITRRSTEVIAALRTALPDSVPIIGVGGIMSLEDAQAKLDAGAALVQIYTGFIYGGPCLVKSLAKGLSG